MLDLKRVGVMSRRPGMDRPIQNLREIFSRASIKFDVLDDERRSPPPDLIIALGGDGTVLWGLSLYPHTPILPINFGDVGFLAAGGQEDFEKLIFRLLANDYLIEERIILVSTFQGVRREVINELVIKGTTKIINVELYVDGDYVHTIRGDGAIVGTPTGSTSYLMATGSPIVAPRVQCMIVNGINEHRFSSRCLILPHTSAIRLRVSDDTRETEMFASHDGRDKLTIAPGEEILIEKATEPSRLIFFDRHVFFRNLKSKLNW